MGLIDIASAILSHATQRVDVSAQNLANATTVGYKARRMPAQAFDLNPAEAFSASAESPTAVTDFAAGKITPTGNAFDLALSGPGFFVVRSRDGALYTRNGQFSRGGDGRLVTSEGLPVQSSQGDVKLGADPKILADGTVLDLGQPVARLSIVDVADTKMLSPAGAGLFSAPDDAPREITVPNIRQGALETSNVSTADEMIAMMASLRSAEMGQHVVQTYDDLMGRALTAFGQS